MGRGTLEMVRTTGDQGSEAKASFLEKISFSVK